MSIKLTEQEQQALVRAAIYVFKGKAPASCGPGTYESIHASCEAIVEAAGFPYGADEYAVELRERYAAFYDFDSRERVFPSKEYEKSSKKVREQRILMLLLYKEANS